VLALRRRGGGAGRGFDGVHPYTRSSPNLARGGAWQRGEYRRRSAPGQ